MGFIWFWLVAVMIVAYVVLDGFDLGVGILHSFLARTDEDKQLMLRSIGPVWDGNEVWLLAGGGTLYFAFPLLYASAGQANIQVPWELAHQSSVPISATLNGMSGPVQTLKVAQFAPAIFATNGQGTGQAQAPQGQQQPALADQLRNLLQEILRHEGSQGAQQGPQQGAQAARGAPANQRAGG